MSPPASLGFVCSWYPGGSFGGGAVDARFVNTDAASDEMLSAKQMMSQAGESDMPAITPNVVAVIRDTAVCIS